jgi:DNA-binding CsgD family transcriptional regulator
MGTEPAWATRSGGGDGDRELERLFEAAEWLRTARLTPPQATAVPLTSVRALVVDFESNIPLTGDELRGFEARFPGISVLVHRPAGDSRALHQSLADVIEAFEQSRRLSPRQRAILRLHLSGHNDKEIAAALECRLTTVCEHWRRMGRKSQGTGKGASIADFHRHLASGLAVADTE